MPVRESRGKEGEHFLLGRLIGSDKSLRRFLASFPAEIRGVSGKGPGSLSLRVIAPEGVLARTRGSGVEFAVELDITKSGGAEAQALAAAKPLDLTTRTPLGLATTAQRYLRCPEVTDATKKLANDYPALCTLIQSPVLADTLGTTPCHALAITDAPAGSPAILLLGGIHGLEWGSCEIALNFAEQLLDAYSNPGTDVTIGGATFTAAQIATLMTTRQIVVFPMVNPDGRAYSQNPLGNAGWRKNRNPADMIPGDPLSIGVDINRNFNFLFDLNKAFVPGCGVMVSSQPGSDVYQGPCAFSEIETNNVLALMKKYATTWLVDLHSGAQAIARPWSDDDTQSNDPQQSFMKAGGNLQRGMPNQGYGEHMVQGDVTEHDRLMGAMFNSIVAANGPAYPVMSAFEFSPSSGTSHDFAYSRHLADPQNFGKILGFVVEWSTYPHPKWLPDMKTIVSEVTAGLFGFAIATQFPLP